MIFRLLWRIISTVSLRCLWKTFINLCVKGVFRIRRFEKEKSQSSSFFPAFTMISLTSQCNYACQGCWVQAKEDLSLPMEMVQNIIDQSKERNSYFFGLLGGEPFLYKDLDKILTNNQDCYFQVFTNGAFLSKEKALKFREAGNVSPLISIEGLESVSDERRKGKNVYQSAVEGLKHSVEAGLLTGVAASICQSNFNELVNPSFLENITALGAHYIWYYIYRPVGPNPCPELILTKNQILELRRFLVDMRLKFPIGIIDTYWDAKGQAVCPGAMGLSHHVSPGGDLEFCPPLQFSTDRLVDGNDFAEKMIHSKFLKNLRIKVSQKTRGCIFMEDPQTLHNWIKEENAFDSSGRDEAFEELSKMLPCVCHHIPGEEIPEKSLMYRIAKRHYFFGFGAYA